MTRRGSSLVEVLVALTILSVGVLGLVGTSTAVTRMLGQGRWSTVTMSHAEERLELLRAAAPDSAGCLALAGGSATHAGGLQETWSVVPGVRSTAIEIVLARGPAGSDTLTAVVPCL